MKPKLLFLSAHLPGPRPPQAGHKTAFRHLQWLAGAYEVHLVAFHGENDGAPDWDQLGSCCASVRLFPVSRSRRLTGILSRPLLPWLAGSRWQGEAARFIAGLTTQAQFARVHFEWTTSAVYRDVLRHVPEMTLNVHDVLVQMVERWGGTGWDAWLWRFEHQRLRRWERRVYGEMGAVFAPSRKDVDLIVQLCPSARERTHLLWPPFDVFPRHDGSAPHDDPCLLFWGAMGRPENSGPARWLCTDVMPLLRARGIRARLLLAGSNPPPDLRALAGPEIEVTGFLADPAPVFSRSLLAVLPIFLGSGLKVKVLECLASGLPVVTTAIGAEGIDATPSEGLLIVPPSPEAFADAVFRLLSDGAALSTMRAGAAAWGRRLGRLDGRPLLLDGARHATSTPN